MNQTENLRQKLIEKLKELFRMDQPELDFGIYRIMQTKREEIEKFFDDKLVSTIKEKFENFAIMDYRKEMQSLRESLISEMGEGSFDENGNVKSEFHDFPMVKRYHEELEELKELEKNKPTEKDIEKEVYEHLYRFFERYYKDGDFICRRYYYKETENKASPYAIPYNGEEVKLVWANQDQYYIKTSEDLTQFSVDINRALSDLGYNEMIKKHEAMLGEQSVDKLKIHFVVVEADEEEHDNTKEDATKQKQYVLSKDEPARLNNSFELVINFEYKIVHDKENKETISEEQKILNFIKDRHDNLSNTPENKDNREALFYKIYFDALSSLAPTDNDAKRILLTKHLNLFVSKNKKDYFIHKDLGTFLNRELNFYIKNEIFHVDDIINSDVDEIEQNLGMIRIFKSLGYDIINFLAQLEDFQKKLWLKKKFVVETNYCITLDRIPKELYPAICDNEAQREEWVNLFAIDEIESNNDSSSEEQVEIQLDGESQKEVYSIPLSEKFLAENQNLVLDTRFFNDSFKYELLCSIDDFDEQCDGLLVHSDNFQALNLLQERYREQIKYIYIDPPYNTGNDGFLYKDSYENSAWLSFMKQTAILIPHLLMSSATFFTSIDDREQALLRSLYDSIFSYENRLDRGLMVWNNAGSTKGFTKIVKNHEYLLAYGKNAEDVESVYGSNCEPDELDIIDSRLQIKRTYRNPLAKVKFPAGLKIEDNSTKTISSPINPGTNQINIINSEMVFSDGILQNDVILEASFPYKNQMTEFFRNIGTDKKTYDTKRQEWLEVYFKTSGVPYFKKKRNTKIISSILGDLTPDTLFTLNDLLPEVDFDNPKPVNLINELLMYFSTDNDICLDYFAGSGTTGHAVINRNRFDLHERKYILVEMGEHFDTVLKPRIQKVIYSEKWRNGKPENRNSGISHCFKYIRLESYEDTLNNLEFKKDAKLNTFFNKNAQLKNDYMLNYVLDKESKDSLLKIDDFKDPCSYKLKIKSPGSLEQKEQTIDLIETFNYLIGLRVERIYKQQQYNAELKHVSDNEAPTEENINSKIDCILEAEADGSYWFHAIKGSVPRKRFHPNGELNKVLIIWRNLSDDLISDNIVLNSWFKKMIDKNNDWKDVDFIYVNGCSALSKIKNENNSWDILSIEQEFNKLMFEIRE